MILVLSNDGLVVNKPKHVNDGSVTKLKLQLKDIFVGIFV